MAAAGWADTDDHSSTTYSWQLQYRQPFLRHLAASLDWLNEGHLPEHRGDGAATQVWLQSAAVARASELRTGRRTLILF